LRLLLPLPLPLRLLLLFFLSSLAAAEDLLFAFVPLSLCPFVPFFPLSLFSPFPRHNLRIPHSIPPYTPPMAHLAIFGMRILETLFFVGMAGSAVVVLISFVEDFRVLFQRDRPRTAEAQEYVQRADSRRIEPGAAASRA
jgi:hypothetical protein